MEHRIADRQPATPHASPRYVDPAMLLCVDELAQIIHETEHVPFEKAEQEAQSLIRLRGMDKEQASQSARTRIHAYVWSWLFDARG